MKRVERPQRHRIEERGTRTDALVRLDHGDLSRVKASSDAASPR
jgi:hypothetical protein